MLMARGVVIRDHYVPEVSFEELKLMKLNELNQKYRDAISTTVSVRLNDELVINMLFAEKDLLMVRAMLDKMTDASIDNGVLVDVDDNVYMNLSKETVDKVYHAMLDAQFNMYMKLKQFQMAINNAETEEELNGIGIFF